MAGYSGTPLVRKLGYRSGMRAHIAGAPENFRRTMGRLPEAVTLHAAARGPLDLVHFFTRSRAELARRFPGFARALAPAGMVWVSWPKRASGVATDLSEDVVREIGLANSLVDVKVCAVDEVWSGLKFVRRAKDRR
jgi:hypothetical protein